MTRVSSVISRPSPNHDPRPAGVPIDMLVLHYTGMRTSADARERLCDPEAKVSAHYLVDEDGATYALVAEDRRAWHAGQSFWRGARDVNARSIGIELVNPGHEFGYRPFPEAQMQALFELCRGILARHPIPARNVVGHSDVAPERKQDPGELFDWPRLASLGIGLWPDRVEPAPVPEAEIVAMLGSFGYDTAEPQAAIRAFHRHFLATRQSAVADGETAGRLKALLRLAA